jgi:hypothetical protein
MNNNDLPKDQTWSKIVGGSFGAAAFLMAYVQLYLCGCFGVKD